MDPHFVIGRFALARVDEAKGKAESAISFAQEAKKLPWQLHHAAYQSYWGRFDA
jgi:hypothetical protein